MDKLTKLLEEQLTRLFPRGPKFIVAKYENRFTIMFTIDEESKMMQLYRKSIIEEKLEGMKPFLPMNNITVTYHTPKTIEDESDFIRTACGVPVYYLGNDETQSIFSEKYEVLTTTTTKKWDDYIL